MDLDYWFYAAWLQGRHSCMSQQIPACKRAHQAFETRSTRVAEEARNATPTNSYEALPSLLEETKHNVFIFCLGMGVAEVGLGLHLGLRTFRTFRM